MRQVILKVDWCSFEAAKYACEKWHYSQCVPAGKLIKIGAWEDDKYIGCVIFGYGANNNIGKPYELRQTEVCELVRVALREHKVPVSQILGQAIKMLKKQCPGLRLIVSYADVDQSHLGIIYQATNWLYTGHILKDKKDGSMIIKGRRRHGKTIHSMGWKQNLDWIRKNIDPNAVELVTKGKRKYLMPLDKKMRKQIEPLRQPYPKLIRTAD